MTKRVIVHAETACGEPLGKTSYSGTEPRKYKVCFRARPERKSQPAPVFRFIVRGLAPVPKSVVTGQAPSQTLEWKNDPRRKYNKPNVIHVRKLKQVVHQPRHQSELVQPHTAKCLFQDSQLKPRKPHTTKETKYCPWYIHKGRRWAIKKKQGREYVRKKMRRLASKGATGDKTKQQKLSNQTTSAMNVRTRTKNRSKKKARKGKH